MSEFARFIRRRSTNNIVTGTIKIVHAGNLHLFDVRIPNGRNVTLATSGELALFPEDPVEVSIPSGDNKRSFIVGKAAVIIGGDPFNRVLASGTD